jgi:hypothetical protein
MKLLKPVMRECNICDWTGIESDCVMCGEVGPLCPECHETTYERPVRPLVRALRLTMALEADTPADMVSALHNLAYRIERNEVTARSTNFLLILT